MVYWSDNQNVDPMHLIQKIFISSFFPLKLICIMYLIEVNGLIVVEL